MNLIETQTRAKQEPFDFMSVRVADEKKSCILVPSISILVESYAISVAIHWIYLEIEFF